MFNTNLKVDGEDDLERTIQYQYARIKSDIEKDWSGKRFSVSSLDKSYLRLSEDTIGDGVLMNESVKIEGDGPILVNDLECVPSRYGRKMEIRQLMQSRIMRCKFSCK